MNNQEHLWSDYWHLLCHRNEVSEKHDFVRFQVFNKEVAVFNDGASAVAFDNRCPHRGARIFDGAHGNQRFVCSYHGWSYANGRLLVGRKESFSHCNVGEADLAHLQTAWLGDFLFVSPAPVTCLAEQLDGTAEALELISKGISDRRDHNTYTYECDWKVAIENALEPYHVPLVHPNSLGALRLQPGRNEYHGRNSIWYSEVGDKVAAKRLKRLARMFNLPWQFEGYVSFYLFPFAMISSTYGYSYALQNFFPAADGRTNFTSRMFASQLADGIKSELLDSFFDSTARLNRQTFEEDHEICKRVPSDCWSPEPPRFWSIHEEKVLQFRQSYSSALAARGELA